MSHDTFLQRLTTHITSSYNLTNQELTVVFPNKRAAYYLRNEFKRQCRQTLWLPQMLSIEEAFTQWSGMTLADNTDLLFELIDIDAQLHQNQDYTSDLNVFGSQAAQMVKDFDEIDQYGIDAQRVFNYVVENKRLEFWDFDEEKSKEKELKYLRFFQSLYAYYRQLKERLSAQEKGYYGMITRHLSELPEAELTERIGKRSVIFAGFNALTTTEERIIDTLTKTGKAEILLDYDRYYVEDENNEAGFFARRYLTKHPDWLKNGISDTLRTEEKHIHVISASGNALQAKALQAKLQETDDHRQAVVLADQQLLIPVLNAIPDTEAYQNFKVSMGYPMAKTPVNQLIKEYFALHRRNQISRKITENGVERNVSGWYIWPVLHLMDLEIVKIAFPKAETAAFSRWKNESVKNGKFIMEDKDIEGLSQMPHIQEFLRIILPAEASSSPAKMLQAVSQLLAFISGMMQAQDNSLFLLNQLSEIGKTVSRLQQVVERNSKYVNDLHSVEILYHLLSSGATLKMNSSETEGLQIMGLLETRNLEFKRLHLLSVNEGVLPPDKSQGSFIPHFIRRAYGLPSYAESQAVVAYHFYRLLQNGEDIYLYYNNLGETSGGEASRFILQIKHELAQNANITVTEEAFGSVAKPSVEAKTLSAQKNDEALARLHYIIETKGLSPSALSTYINCPLKYYMRYIAQIKDNSVDEDTGTDVIGTIIHDTLEFLFADYLPHDGKRQLIDKVLFDEKIMPRWEQKLAQSIEKNLPNGFPDVGFNFLNRVTIEQQLKNYLKYTSKQLEHNDLVILETEGELKASLSTPYGECLFKGRTDRIDLWDNTIRVIDYKSGHVESADLKIPVRHQSESDLDYLKQIPEKALQLLLYKYMYLKENPLVSPEQVEGAIHGLKYANAIEFGLTKAQPKKDDAEADANFLENNNFIHNIETMLEAVVGEMLDTETPFVQTDDDKKCGYCEFKLICKR